MRNSRVIHHPEASKGQYPKKRRKQEKKAEQNVGRGFLTGVLFGLLLSVIAVAAVSLLSSNSNMVQTPPDADALEVPAGTEFNQAKPEEETVVPEIDTAPPPEEAPMSPVMAEAEDAPEIADADPEGAPEATTPVIKDEAGLVTPEVDNGNMVVVPQDSDSASAVAQATQPDTPQIDAAPSADTAVGSAPAAAPDAQVLTEPTVDNVTVPESPTPEVAALPAGETPKTPVPPTSETVPTVEPEYEPVEPENEAAPEKPDSIRVPVPEIRNLAPNVQINRLPTIGGGTEPIEDAEKPVVNDVEPGSDADQGALEAYAMAYENPEAKPMMSIILIDTPGSPISDDALSHLPFALSFAVDASREDASAVAARYRAAGFEVLMLADLPTGAAARDVEVAFEAYSIALPEAVAVLDLVATARTATQIAGILADRGFGLVLPSKGLNSAHKAAIREGVPAALIYRELDAENENPTVIRRYLDRAAFRVAQEGSVVMLGRTHQETIEALVLWALEDRAASVAIAPVSAVLMGQ